MNKSETGAEDRKANRERNVEVPEARMFRNAALPEVGTCNEKLYQSRGIGKLSTGQFGPTITLSQEELAMSVFRFRAEVANREGFVGGFPNFYVATYGPRHVGGTIFVRAPAAEWRDVPLALLGNPSLNDFGGRFRGTQEYATSYGFVGGFPNFFHADYGRGIVCGTILVTSEGAERRDVPLAELGNNLNDIGARFRGTQDYAARNGFVGGFPNMFHADYGNGIVCGTILLKQNVAEWRDVLLWVLH